jgi:CheY-like chemotaxis protein
MQMQKCVLVVDDDPMSLELMKRYLPRFGVATVLLASNGAKALEMLQEHQIDLVILDIMMPHINGYELAALIREEPMLARIPLIAMTSQGMFEGNPQADRAGIQLVIAKPFNHCMLKEALDYYLGASTVEV